MQQLLLHEQQRQGFGSAARAEVERRFSLGAMVRAYQAVYDRASGLSGR